MNNLPYPFKSKQGEAEYLAAYDTMMAYWPVPYESIDIPGTYGCTHLVASGPKDAPPLVLLHGGRASLTMWSANVGDLSQDYRVYAVDIIGQPGKSIPDHTFKKRDDLIPWFTGLLDCAHTYQRASLVGQSYGGWFALALCPAHAGKSEQARAHFSGGLFPSAELAAHAERREDVLFPYAPGDEELQAVGDLSRQTSRARKTWHSSMPRSNSSTWGSSTSAAGERPLRISSPMSS